MKICFIWIAKFRNFEDLGFNLSSSSKFSFNYKEGFISKLENFDSLPKDFFGENITDVTGVVGKNGVGKSNAITLVCAIIKSSKTSLKSDFLIIVEDNDEFYCYTDFENRIQINSNFNLVFKPYIGSIDPLKVVFFSNVFDERRNDFSSEVADISVNKSANRGLFYRKGETTDFEKQIKLIESKVFPQLNIEIPEKVRITIRISNSLSNSPLFDRDVPLDLYEPIRMLARFINDRIRDIKPINKFIILTKFIIFTDFIKFYYRKNALFKQDSSTLTQGLEQVNFSMSAKNVKTDDIIDHLLELTENILSSSRYHLDYSYRGTAFERKQLRDIEDKTEVIRQQISFVREIKYNLDAIMIDYSVEGLRQSKNESFLFDYYSEISKNFIHSFVRLFGVSNLFDINWIGISSGHRAYINLFASLYQELRFTRHTNLLLCIDEGDLYLHPIWQTEFFSKLLFVLPNIFNGSVQLILTSHSPFLLSDLPNQSITILDKDVDGSALNGVDLDINTFGGNLYDLYSKPFFLGDKRMSAFAHEKIMHLISVIEDMNKNNTLKNMSSEELKILKKQVSIIGDEVIKFKLERALGK